MFNSDLISEKLLKEFVVRGIGEKQCNKNDDYVGVGYAI